MSKYKLDTTKRFDRDFVKLTRRNEKLRRKVETALKKLVRTPFQKDLRTHKVDTKIYGHRFSSRVTGDIRIIWDFIDNRTVILALAVGGHEGGRKVYK